LAFIKKILPAQSDPELIKLYKSGGDVNVLGELYAQYMEMVYGVCLKYFKEPEEAKDAVINIFEELVTKLKKYEVSNFKSWLYQLTKNYCLTKIRSRKSKPVTVDIDIMHLQANDHLDIVAKEIEKEAQLDGMADCIEQLPGEQKHAIQLFYLEDKCYKDIADITETEVSKVRSFIQNGRRNLKICMEKKALEQTNERKREKI
jgi:RNA polymerase sigma factor (sigma-70 family)